jgi:hypothetical protein
LEHANQELLDKVHKFRDSKALIFDLDSTHLDTYGHQESVAYNAHYDTIGFHPLVAFEGDLFTLNYRQALSTKNSFGRCLTEFRTYSLNNLTFDA